jgi:hypothetical protein
MEIKFSTIPPDGIYERAREIFGVDFNKGVVFTVGDTIHSKDPIPAHLYEHEKIHVFQQLGYTGGTEAWWEKYFEDVDFRYSQEVEAYKAQYRYFCTIYKDRNKRAVFLHQILGHLKTMYGFESFPIEKIKKDII